MRIAAVSDLHGQLPSIPPCDLLLIAGDVCPLSDHRGDAQRAFLEGPFSAWLARAPARAIAGIAGNHDLIAEREPALLAGLPWSYLCDSEADLVGLRIWGSPFAVTYGEWAFMESDDELERRFAAIPAGLDVLLVHGPPYGILDHALRGVDTGSRALRRAIAARPPLARHLRSHPRGPRRGPARVDALSLGLPRRRALRAAPCTGRVRARATPAVAFDKLANTH